MAGTFAFKPQLVARAAEEGREAGLDGFAEGFFVHEADHQDAAGLVILDHGRKQSIEFFEIQLHNLSPKKKARQDQPAGSRNYLNRCVIKNEPVAAWDARGDDGVRDDGGVRRT